MQKAIFITGAAKGIGRATALQFAKNGWFVGVFDVDGERTALLDLDRLLAPEQAEVQGIPA